MQIEEKNKKIEDLIQNNLKLHFEIEESNQTLEQYNNFENAFKDNINSLNDNIFQNEKNMKNYEINTKNLKLSLTELFKMNNLGELDNKLFNKIKEINLFKSHDELIYIIKW